MLNLLNTLALEQNETDIAEVIIFNYMWTSFTFKIIFINTFLHDCTLLSSDYFIDCIIHKCR